MTATEPAASYVRVVDSVLEIAISTSDNGSSMDFGGINAGSAALRDLDPSVGAILLVGTGANFCSGGNVRAFAAAPDRGEYIRGLAADLHVFVRLLEAAPVPVVAAVHGWAAGAGMSLVCAADIAIGGPATRLRPAYPGIGLSPDGGMSWTLPRIVGPGRAAEIILTDAVLTGDDAVRLGILGRLVGDDVIGEEALRVARTLAAGPRSSYTSIKELLAASPTSTLSDQLDREEASIAAAANGPTGIEGVNAFVEKRRPNFNGVDAQS
ncbi:enoyl-CoA hydratase/isomerase family protein [Aldersonia kunmingensis]|uniref:enoyl-CoA hydratase/isomerase family protein n=1 Tax=Aldersonia kunmingensis TaxID=408066 RepID=UPI00082F6E65|nr:enoyl-CoA hydratase-related protein [Aldersonia kunmingensis]